MSYDKEQLNAQKEVYNQMNKQECLNERHINDNILEGYFQQNSEYNNQDPNRNVVNSNTCRTKDHSNNLLSNHKPTLINNYFILEEDSQIDKGNIDQQINIMHPNYLNNFQDNIHNNFSYSFNQIMNCTNNLDEGLMSLFNESSTNLVKSKSINFQGYTYLQTQKYLQTQDHIQMNYNQSKMDNHFEEQLGKFLNFQDVKMNENEKYYNSSENTSQSNTNDCINNSTEDSKNQLNSTTKGKLHICLYDECKQVFKAKKSLRDHLRIHTNQRPYSCDELNCGKSFVQYSSLQKHQRIHKGDRPYKCDYFQCDQAFTQVSNLKRHQKIHQNEKPYECDQCQRKFTTSSNLKQHQTTHESQKIRQRFICLIDDCGKSYLYSSSLKKHEKEHILNSNVKSSLHSVLFGNNKIINENCEMHGNKVQKYIRVSNIQSDEGLEEQTQEINEYDKNQENYDQDLSNEENETYKKDIDSQSDSQKSKDSDEISSQDNLNKGNQFFCLSNKQESHNSQSQKVLLANQKQSKNKNAFINQKNQIHSNQQRQNIDELDMLNLFFNSHNIALQHDGHYDVLFKGYLYHFNKKTGKIENHDIQAQDEIKKGICQPLNELTHNKFENIQKKQINDKEETHNQFRQSSQTNGNCCQQEQSISKNVRDSKQQDSSSDHQLSKSSNIENPESDKNTTINEIKCCNDPSCTFGNTTNSQTQQINKEYNQNISSSIKTEDCCCTVDNVKTECTCVGCDESCQSCSKVTPNQHENLNDFQREQKLLNQQNTTTQDLKLQRIQREEQRNTSNYQNILKQQESNKENINKYDKLNTDSDQSQFQSNQSKNQNNNNKSINKSKKQSGCICHDTLDYKHLHGPNCGHTPIYHHGHIDYIVENQLHHPHGNHCDFHGTVNVIENIIKL